MTDRQHDTPADARRDPKPGKHLWQGLAVIALLVLALWALQHFGRDGTRVTPGGTEVPQATGRGQPTAGGSPGG
jgi:hypothetical protein